MSHDGRMARGKDNFSKNILLDNEDTKYYLANREEVKKDIEEDTKPVKKGKKKND